MTQEEKQLLLKDLCVRVPYHPKGHVVNTHTGAACDEWLTCATFLMFTSITNNCRLYLRPMSSMTEEEKQVLELCNAFVEPRSIELKVDFYNKQHLDYRGLIEKGLAIEAPNGMYK